jgi:processive 1,2-diacylglycerol beta-glucosyltransferase
MPPRVLVLSASVGAGHLRAAEAVELALRQTIPDAVVRNLDVLEMTNTLFRRVYGKFYLDLVNHAPHALGYFYDLTDQPSRSGKNRADRVRLALEKLNLKPFMRFLKAEPWDLVINTHFLPAEIIAALRKRGELNLPQVTVTTDFDTHKLWVNQPCERFYTATEEGAIYLRHWGIPAETIFVTGIPIHPVFSTPKDRTACLHKHGLAQDRPVILQLSGGFGVGPIEKLFDALLQVQKPIQLVTITGRNEALKEKLSALVPPPRHQAKVIGFTKEIDELMQAADLVVTKPGGLTTSEVLARAAVMVIINPIPGQETRNSDFLLENGAAIKVSNAATLPYKVDRLLTEPERLERLRENIRRIAKPQAAFDVVANAMQLIRAVPSTV